MIETQQYNNWTKYTTLPLLKKKNNKKNKKNKKKKKIYNSNLNFNVNDRIITNTSRQQCQINVTRENMLLPINDHMK